MLGTSYNQKKQMKTSERYAIWKAHNMKCAYTGKIIDSIDYLEIDHIIPQSTSEKKLEELIVKYSLSNDFKCNSYENLLPCLKRINRLKSNKIFDESSIRYFINIAKSKKTSVIKRLNEFESKIKIINAEFLELAQTKETDMVKKGFETKRETTNVEFSNNHYWNSKNKVALNGFLPSIYKEEGSFVIEFKNLETMITLGHKQILKMINLKKESSLKEIIFNGYTYEKTKSFIIIGTNAIHIENDIFKDLIYILNDYLNTYERNYKTFENYIGAKNFKKYKQSNFYILKQTTRDKWNYLIKYSKKYDIDNGNSEKYCFNFNRNRIIALDKNFNSLKFNLIPSQIEEGMFYDFSVPDNKLYILWEIPTLIDRKRIASGEIWTLEKTKYWIDEILSNQNLWLR